MRMDRFAQIASRRTHLDRQHAFGQNVSGVHANYADARMRSLSGSISSLVKPSVRPSATAGRWRPGILDNLDRDVFRLGLFFGQPGPGNLGSVNTIAGIAAGWKAAGSSSRASTATLP